MKKKILAFFLALCMVFGLTNVSAYAEDATGTQGNPEVITALGEVTTSIPEGNTDGYYYSYTVPSDLEGTAVLTVSVSNATEGIHYGINVDNITTGKYCQLIYNTNYGADVTTGTIKVSANDSVSIYVYSMATGDVSAPAVDVTWTASSKVAGTQESPEEIATMSQYGEFAYNGSTDVAVDGSIYYYEYTAETSGTLSVYLDEWNSNPGSIADLNAEIVMTNANTDASVKYSTDTVEYVVNSMWGSSTYNAIQLEVAEGDKVTFEFSSASTAVETATIAWCAAIDPPVGSEGNPYVITELETTVTVPAGEAIYLEAPYDYLDIAEAVYFNGTAVVFIPSSGPVVVNGDGSLDSSFIESLMNSWDGPIFGIGNEGDAAVECTITFDVPEGVYVNPEVIEDEAEHTFVTDEGFYYYEWIASADGIVTISAESTSAWMLAADNMTTGSQGDWYNSDDDGKAVVAVSKGDELLIWVSAMNAEYVTEPGTVTTSVDFVKSVGTVLDAEYVTELMIAINSGTIEEIEGLEGFVNINLKVNEDDSIEIIDPTATVIPAEILKAVKEHNELVDEDEKLDIIFWSDAYAWVIEGDSIESTLPIDLGIVVNTENIPEATIKAIAQGNEYNTFSIAHDGEFGFDAVLEFFINVEEYPTFVGKNAALYWDNNGTLELVGEKYAIDETGIIAFAMNDASDYVLVIEGTATTDDGTGDGQTEIPDMGDNAGLYIAILMFGCAAVVVAFVAKKKFA